MENLIEGRTFGKEVESVLDPTALNAVETWVIGGSLYVEEPNGRGGITIFGSMLSNLLKTNEGRKLALTPKSILEGKSSIEDVNRDRLAKPLITKCIAVFGEKFMFSDYRYRVDTGPLGDSGQAEEMMVRIIKNDEVVDPALLDIEVDPFFDDLLEEIEIVGNMLVMKVKGMKNEN